MGSQGGVKRKGIDRLASACSLDVIARAFRACPSSERRLDRGSHSEHPLRRLLKAVFKLRYRKRLESGFSKQVALNQVDPKIL